MTTSTNLTTPSSTTVEQLTSALESTMSHHHIPGLSLAVTNSDGLLFARGFGYADLATGTPATETTQYLWFSLTKIATATAAMRLADEGRIDLARPVADFVPEYRSGDGPAPTVRNLLNHTAGLANPIPVRWVRPVDQPAPDSRTFLDTLLRRNGTAKYPVGAAARYSNLGYLILSEIIAQATGRSFIEHLSDAVLHPLAMTRTGFEYRAEDDAAVGYVRAPRLTVPLLRAVLPDGIVGPRVGRYSSLNRFLVNGAGYGGLVGDVIDAARLAAMHLGDGTLGGETVLQPATARAMRDISAPGKPFDLGLGWFRKPTASRTMAVEHLGAGGGFYNAMRLYPGIGLGIVAMANTTTAWDHAALFDAIARLDWAVSTV